MAVNTSFDGMFSHVRLECLASFCREDDKLVGYNAAGHWPSVAINHDLQ